MSVTRTAHVTKDTWIAKAVGGTKNYGNGTTAKITVGPAASATATYKGRGLFEVPLIDDDTGDSLFAGLSAITAASLKIVVANEECATRGGTQRIFLEQLDSGFAENTATGNCVVATSGSDSAKWPGPLATTDNRVLFTASGPATNTVVTVSILALLQAAMAAGDTVFRFRLIAANTAGDGYAEETTARTITFFSSKASDTTKRPYIEITADTTDANAKPMSLAIAVSLAMTVTSGAAFTVDGQKGKITVSQPNTEMHALLSAVSQQDVDVSCQFSIDKIPVAGHAIFRLLARVLNTSNYYRLTFRADEAQVIELFLDKKVAGVETTLATRNDVGLNFLPGTVYDIELRATGLSPTTLSGRVWRHGTTQPDWKIIATDSAAALQANGSLGINVEVTTVTNAPLVYSVDEFSGVPA